MVSLKRLIPGKTIAWQPFVATGTLVLWLFLLYGRSLYQVTPIAFRSWWWVFGPVALTFEFLNPVFHSEMVFIGSYVLGIGLIIWMLVSATNQWVWRLAALLCGLAAFAFPPVMVLTYGEYHVPVSAVEGYELRWVTEPTHPYVSAFKQAQLTHEAGCDYHLSGWSAENALYYTSECLPGVGRYALNTELSTWSLFLDGRVSLDEAAVTRWDGHVYLSPPRSLTEAHGYPFLTLERAVAPNGQWEAVVVRWFYGPSDIVLVRQAK